jgi:hypothetical protein
LRRLALPFALFWPLLAAATGVAALAFLHRMARGSWGLDTALLPANARAPQTMHLWFLWMLIWYSVAGAAVLRAAGRRTWQVLQRAGVLLRALGTRPWGPAVLALPLAAVGAGYPNGFVVPSGSFLPQAAEWLHNGLFFVFGLALFAHQRELFAHYERRWKRYALAGMLPFLLTGALVEQHAAPVVVAFVYNACSWLWSFAWIGLGLRVLGTRRPGLAWLADSAYWVYLVHLPLTIVFGLLLFGLPLPALVKLALNIGATTLVCLASYRWCVRGRAIGRLLSGTPAVAAAVAPGAA